MLDTGPSSGARPATIGSMPSTYQRTPSMARSTSAWASRQGLPISQTSSSASSRGVRSRASSVAATRARRSGRGRCRQARCWSRAARTAWWAVAPSRRGGPAIGLPSTGLTAGRARPSACQAPFQRLRTRSSRKASGATARQRCQASGQDVPDLRVRVGAMGLLRSRCTVGGGRAWLTSRGCRDHISCGCLSSLFETREYQLRRLGRCAAHAHPDRLQRLLLRLRAVPDEPDTIAPAWPIVLPSGAVNPAM